MYSRFRIGDAYQSARKDSTAEAARIAERIGGRLWLLTSWIERIIG
jgi:hypothetical protein